MCTGSPILDFCRWSLSWSRVAVDSSWSIDDPGRMISAGVLHGCCTNIQCPFNRYYLLGGFKDVLCSIVYGMSSFQLTFIFCKMVKTTNQDITVMAIISYNWFFQWDYTCYFYGVFLVLLTGKGPQLYI